MKYTNKKKLAVVQDYFSGAGGQRAFAEQYGVDLSASRSWVINDHKINQIAQLPPWNIADKIGAEKTKNQHLAA